MAISQINIGVLATLIGPLLVMGEDGVRGVQLAIDEFDGVIGDKPVNFLVESTNAIPQSARDAAERLVERKHVDFVIGPLSGNEGLAVRDYAKTRQERAFLNGSSATQDITLRDPAPNFFNFSSNGVQWMAGLGTYAYETLGYRRVVTIAEDYSYPHGQVGGFMIEFCRAGGRVIQKFWLPLGTINFRAVIKSFPVDTDAIFVALAGADAFRFLTQYEELGGKSPLLGGTSVVDQSVLGIKGALSERLIGMVSSGPTADNNPAPEWQKFVKVYRQRFPDGLPSPSQVCYSYFVNTKAALSALRAIGCDLSNNQARFKEALRALEFETPTGPVKLDHNRQAIANMFLTAVDKDIDGRLYSKLVKTIPNVNQTLGIDENEFLQIGPLTADNPNCPYANRK